MNLDLQRRVDALLRAEAPQLHDVRHVLQALSNESVRLLEKANPGLEGKLRRLIEIEDRLSKSELKG